MDLDRVVRLVAATSAHLRTELAALDDEGASFHPEPGEWCAKQVVGHLIEADRRGFSGRIRVILAADNPVLEAWDQPSVAAARDDCSRTWDDLLGEFERERAGGLSLLAEMRESDLDRAGRHPLVGELSVRDVVYEWPFHDRDHLRQLLANTRSWLWPALGAARRFTELEG